MATQGYSTQSDALVQMLNDGTNLNDVWAELNSALAEYNTHRSAITSVLAHGVTVSGDAVLQGQGSGSEFERASEFGEPKSLRAPSNALVLGNTFEDYDMASRYTWKFLRSATLDQVRSVTNLALEADNRLVNGTILSRLFDNTETTNEYGHRVFSTWNGDSIAPPAALGNTFTAPHSHFLVSGASVVDSGDLEEAISHVTEHNYGTDPSSQILAFVNPAEGDLIASFHAGVESRAGGPKALHSYIPSLSAPAYLTPDNLVGNPPPAEFGTTGLKIQGSYGPAWIINSYYIPAGYIAVVATNGPNHPKNVISLRQHENPVYQGLRIIPGPTVGYPLTEAFFCRAFGVGVRHRSAACVIKIAASGEYTVPVIPL